MLFSKLGSERVSAPGGAPGPVTAFHYRSTEQTGVSAQSEDGEVQEPELQESEVRITEAMFAQRLAEERALGSMDAEARMRRDYEQKLAQERAHERAKISESVRSFELTRKEYFAKVEGEVVQLALSIAGKILHREAQVDPLLIAALVQIALSQMKEGSAVSVRVRPEEAPRWREQLEEPAMNAKVTVIEDMERQPGDCVLETELGSVNFSLEAQLKEVERGFLDVLARTPQL